MTRTPPRRLRIAALATLLVLALAVGAAVGWFVVVPRAWPSLQAGEGYGIDVLNHQGTIDWPRVAADGVGFAYLKATEGRSFVDPYFADNWANTKRVGIRRGAYHFFSLCSPCADQAETFLRTAPPDPAALSPALDLEILGGCDDRPPIAAVQAELDVFTQRVEQAWGRPMLIYARGSWTKEFPVRAARTNPTDLITSAQLWPLTHSCADVTPKVWQQTLTKRRSST